MADDRYSWLDKDAAERLLRGEPAGSQVGDGARELEQLLKAAAAAGSGLPETAALPGEEAALAAFRQAGHGPGARSRESTRGAALPGTRTTRTHRVVERTGLARPFRRGLAVALAACAISGIAVAAGTGVLPTPFRDGEPRPASSVPAAETPNTLETDEPATTPGETGRTPATPPDGRTTAPGSTPTPGGSHDTAPAPGTRSPGTGTPGDDGKPLPDDGEGSKKRKLLLALCKEYESGRRGDLDRDTLQRLEGAAGGPGRVHTFCRQYLSQAGQQGGGSGDNDGGDGGKGGHGDGKGGDGGGKGGKGGKGGGQNGGGSGDEEGDSPPAAAPPVLRTGSPGPSAPATGGTPAPAPSTAATTPAKNLPTGRV
ncbi:hypothetical protein [Streptomyces sp. S186]|uniref:hypothetical protein n=1 Tax=Streptomyces sp. S186 TaxID=3434395 RepID=UPI003F6709D5